MDAGVLAFCFAFAHGFWITASADSVGVEVGSFVVFSASFFSVAVGLFVVHGMSPNKSNATAASFSISVCLPVNAS